MHFPVWKLTLALSSLVVMVCSAPVGFEGNDTTVNEVAPYAIFGKEPDPDEEPKPQYVNDCAESTFNTRSYWGSPTVADCEVIIKNIDGRGSWTTGVGYKRELVRYGTCAFTVKTKVWQRDPIYKVGNADIIDVIRDSIAQFEWNGLVGASGKMKCQGNAEWFWITVYWEIKHT